MFWGKILLAGYTTLAVLVLFSVNCYARKSHHHCDPSSCGNNDNITNPFRLKGDPKGCGDNKYELECENNRTVLHVFSGKYYVEEINYDNNTIRVVDVGIHKDDCSSLPLHSLTYDNFIKYYQYDLSHASLVVFMNCENPVKSPLYIDNNNRGSCTKGGGNSSGSVKGQYLYVVVGDLNVSDVADLCTVEMMVPIAQPPLLMNISFLDVHNAMAYRFELSFDSYHFCPPNWSSFHYKNLAARYYRANQEAIRVLLRIPATERESSTLLGFEQTYNYQAPRRGRVTDFLRKPTPEPDPTLPPVRLVPTTTEQEMAKIRAIKSMITGDEGDSQPPEATGGTSSTPAGQQEGAVLALASEHQAGRPKKKQRREAAGQGLVDEDSTKVASTDLGDQTEQHLPRKSKGKAPAAPPVWAPEFVYKGRAVSAADSVSEDKDCSLGFNLTKGLILPGDMQKHEELPDLKVLRSAAESIVLAAQKNFLAHERMVAVRQSLRDAITENKVLRAEIDMLKAEQVVVKDERDELRQKLDRAEEDKKKAEKKAKARYLAELRKLRDAHKAEKDKAVDDAEDRGYAQGEKTYERQVRATKDIFFQCGWKAAVEKVGLGRDSDMFNNLPAAHIPDYMQAYANATQNRLIVEARKEAEEEAAAQNQTEQVETPTEQTSSDASPNAEGGNTDREVVTLDGTDPEAEENLPEQTPSNAEVTGEEAEQGLDLD